MDTLDDYKFEDIQTKSDHRGYPIPKHSKRKNLSKKRDTLEASEDVIVKNIFL